jgi:hypothetical protein
MPGAAQIIMPKLVAHDPDDVVRLGHDATYFSKLGRAYII